MPISDADIDPCLLAESEPEDPAMAIFRRAQSLATTSLLSTESPTIAPSSSLIGASAANDMDNHSDGDDEEMFTATVAGAGNTATPAPPDVLATIRLSRLANLARLIKANKTFKPKSEADLEKYCGTFDAEERHLLGYILNLEIRDRLDDIASPVNWTMSESLKKNIILFTKVFVLSATTKSYKGNGHGHVLKAMRELGIGDLPAEKDVLQVNEVVSFISDRLTSARNVVKNKIKESLETDSGIANIADLTQSLISKTPIKHTLQLYMRLAFLRWHMVKYGDDTEFWDKVDGTLAKWLETANSGQDLALTFKMIYDDDIKTHGDPSTTRFKVASPNDVDDWYKTLEKHASEAQGAAKKRKRT